MTDLSDRVRTALRGRYEIERHVGSGGSSLVYLAQDLRHHRPVAIKVLRPELAGSLASERFLREIALAAPLTHPNILPLYDSGQVGDLLYYVMPYVEGESLRGRLEREGPLPLPDTIAITNDVAHALDFAHDHGVVHRDIKPENILLPGGQAVVADFGIAVALHAAGRRRMTTPGWIVGTPSYMSPEQCSGADVGPRSDVYSLGCVVYEMLAGDPPFHGATTQAICARHRNERPPSVRVVRPGVPHAIEQAVLHALEKIAADRPATAGEFAQDLARAIPGPPAPPPHRVARALRWGVRFAPVVLLLAVAAWVLTRLPGPPEPAPFEPTEIATRPLSVFDPTGQYGWLGDALGQEIAHALGGVAALSVVGPAAFRAYPASVFPLDSIARLLEVGTIVEGTVTVLEDSVRVSVHFTDGRTLRQRGSVIRATVPRGRAVQLTQLVVYDLVSELRRTLGREIEHSRWRQETDNSIAWQAVGQAQALRGHARRIGGRPDRLEIALRLLDDADVHLQRAIEADRRWLLPVALQGWLYADRVWLLELVPGIADSTTAIEWLERGLTRAAGALAMRPEDPRALELRGLLRVRLWHWSASPTPRGLDSARADLEAAVQADPHRARAWLSLGTVYQRLGDFEAAARATAQAREADAWLDEVERAVARQLFDALRRGDTASASADCAFGKRHYPEDPLFIKCGLDIVGWGAARRADVARAWELLYAIERHPRAAELAELADQWHYRRILVAAVAARARLVDSARAIVRAARAGPAGAGPPRHWLFAEAWVDYLLGDTATAIDKLDRYLQAEPGFSNYVRQHPWFQGLHTDPRFQRLTQPSSMG